MPTLLPANGTYIAKTVCQREGNNVDAPVLYIFSPHMHRLTGLVLTLENKGFRIISAESFKEASGILAAPPASIERADLILVDEFFFSRLRAPLKQYDGNMGYAVNLILFTDFSQSDEIRDDDTVFATIVKPFDTKDVVSTIRCALSQFDTGGWGLTVGGKG